MALGVPSGSKRASPSSSSASERSSVTSPRSSPASSVSRPETVRTRSTTPPPRLRRSRKRIARCTSDWRSACQRPATWTTGLFAAASSARSASPRSRSPTARRQSKLASASVLRRPLDCAPSRALTFARMRAGALTHAVGSNTGTSRCSSCGISSRRKTAVSSVSSVASPRASKSRSPRIGSRSASCSSRSPTGSPSRTNAKPSSPCRSSATGKLSVGSSVACSHCSTASASRPGRSSRCRPSCQRVSRISCRPRSTQRESRRSSVT